MKKIILLFLSLFYINISARDGGAIGLQLGKITFGLGGSSKGPIIGVGPSPDNNLPISAVVVPGGCNCCNCCCR